jgi:chorismate-pyruvate lyase
MNSIVSAVPRRELFSPTPGAHQRAVLKLLLAQDGSTTRLCEAVAGGPVELQLLHQQLTTQVPSVVRDHLAGTTFIERVTCLVAHGEVLMDNLTFIAVQGLEPDMQAALCAGQLPIGHLLSRWWVRRQPVVGLGVEALAQHLWRVVGLPDASATRTYGIATPEAVRMVITETYRRGMLTGHQAATTP